ncbi:uncharacterized protein LOC134841143 isoform X2 [Symsagittifera roscoffensis]|uniref:uncharacterized protein LOC134841143 isoform X2 n=1 Tax=Symsagittifera roscoffensis TaxID=84072 RepID=UPI00307C0C21
MASRLDEKRFFCQMEQPSLKSGNFKPCTCGTRAYSRHHKCYQFLPSFNNTCEEGGLTDAIISDTTIEELMNYMRSEIVDVFQRVDPAMNTFRDIEANHPHALYISGKNDLGDPVCYKLNSDPDEFDAFDLVECSTVKDTMPMCSSPSATGCPAEIEYGNGDSCSELKPCSLEPCHEDANCESATDGTITCTCPPLWVGDGVHFCIPPGTCNADFGETCHDLAECINGTCVCNEGYEGDGWVCTDIDECSPENRDANCAPDFTDCTNYALNVDNKRYTCECSPGNQGDPNPPSQGCEEKPRNCSHAIAEDIVSPSGEEFLPTGLFLDISDDPASPQFEEIEVLCNKDGDTKLPSETPECSSELVFSSDQIKLKASRVLVENDAYMCMQRIEVCCAEGDNLKTSLRYLGYNDNWSQDFGGEVEGQCSRANGDPEECTEVTPLDTDCKCNKEGKNFFWVTDRAMLPVKQVEFLGSAADGIQAAINDVICLVKETVTENIVMYRNCEEALEDNEFKAATYMLQFEGEFFDAFCYRARSKDQKGSIVTQLTPKMVESSGSCSGYDLQYTASAKAIQAVVNASIGCMQHVSFDCNGNPIFADDQMVKYYGPDGQFSSFGTPSSDHVYADSCPCGVFGECEDPSKKCNCDSGTNTTDEGYVTENLPITRIENCNQSPSGSLDVGVLFCYTKKHVRLPYSCQHYAELHEMKSGIYMISTNFRSETDDKGMEECLVKCNMHEQKETVYGSTEVAASRKAPTVKEGSVSFEFSYESLHNCKVEKLLDMRWGKRLHQKLEQIYVTQEILVTQCPTADVLNPEMKLSNEDGEEVCECSEGLKDACASGAGDLPLHVKCSCSSIEGTGAEFKGKPIAKVVINDPAITGDEKYDIFIGNAEFKELGRDCFNFQDNRGQARKVNQVHECMNKLVGGSGGRPVKSIRETGNGRMWANIDPDGAGGVDPFQVRCLGDLTVVDSSVTRVGNCFNVTYKRPASAIQLRALAEVSKECCQGLQTIGEECESISALMPNGSQTFTFYNFTGVPLIGYPGQLGRPDRSCAQGGQCKNEEGKQCDPVDLKDFNNILILDDSVFLSKICSNDPEVDLDSCQWKLADPHKKRPDRNTAVKCSRHRPICTGRDCHESQLFSFWAKENKFNWKIYSDIRSWTMFEKSGVQIIDPSQVKKTSTDIEKDPCTVCCQVGPDNMPYSQTVLPLEAVNNNSELSYFDSESCFEKVIDASTYCYQDIAICGNSEGVKMSFASGNDTAPINIDSLKEAVSTDKMTVLNMCFSSDICCAAGDDAVYVRIVDKDQLPTKSFTLESSGAVPDVKFAGTVCSKLEPTCVSLTRNHRRDMYINKYLESGYYAVDPDGPGVLEPIMVHCDFDHKDPNNSISTPEGQKDPEDGEDYDLEELTNKTYVDQVNKLAEVSGFCKQLVDYNCVSKAHLGLEAVNVSSGRAQFDLYSYKDGQFGPGASHYGFDYVGCVCSTTYSCSVKTDLCNCDADGAGYDGAHFMDKDSLPVTFVAGPEWTDAQYTTTVHQMQCADNLPVIYDNKTCDDLVEAGVKEGYIVVDSDIVGPVFCKEEEDQNVLTIYPDKVTDPDEKSETEEQFDCSEEDKVIDIDYAGLTNYDQMKIKESHTCHQYIRFCSDSIGVSGNLQWYSEDVDGVETGPYTVWGGQESGCTCKRDDTCFDRSKECNTDALSGVNTDDLLCDGGYMDYKQGQAAEASFGFLTRVVVKTDSATQGNCSANITIGPVRCMPAEEIPKTNECEEVYDDCFPRNRSECIEQDDGFTCECMAPYTEAGNEKGGRNCVDVDECERETDDCNKHAECTNLDPKWECTCGVGFTGSGSDTYQPNGNSNDDGCFDINECEYDPSDPNADTNGPCGDNALCYNTYGSFACVCPYGYSGNAYVECQPQCECLIWGDPHYITCDGLVHHYMGNCRHQLLGPCQSSMVDDFPFVIFGTNVLDKGYPDKDGVVRTKKDSYTSSMRSVEAWFRHDTTEPFVKILMEMDRIEGGDVKKSLTIDGIGKRSAHNIKDAQKRFTVDQEGDNVVLRLLGFGQAPVITITWDGIRQAKIEAKKGYVDDVKAALRMLTNESTVCGLCGNYDGIPGNDRLPKWPDTHYYYRDNYRNLDAETDPASCKDDPPSKTEDPSGICGPEMLPEATEVCDMIMTEFKECIDLFSKTSGASAFRDACMIDHCKLNDSCSTIRLYFDMCKSMANGALRAKIEKELSICEVECEEGFEPKNCSSEMAFQCDLVCGSPQNETMCAQQMCNPSMCVCKDGLYREGSRCIPKEDCGCFKSAEDGYFKNGDFYINEDCTSNCTCKSETGQFDCADNLMCDLEIAVCGLDTETSQHTCDCNEGYRIGQYANGTWHCQDINECEEGLSDCKHTNQTCTNTIGGYTCKCDKEPGYIDDPDSIGEFGAENCLDVDECADESDDCEVSRPDSTCVNYPGAYYCECNEGFVLNEATGKCDDINECSQSTTSDIVDCVGPGSVCKNTIGSFECFCKDGFRNLTFNSTECEDIPHCAEELDDCDVEQEASCKDSTVAPFYTCQCTPGYMDNPVTLQQGGMPGRDCIDVDECLLAPKVCDEYANCTNNVGSYACECNEGFNGTGQPGECDNINECSVGSDNCHDNATCIDAVPMFTCDCNTGFKGSGTECENVDECEENLHDCNLTRSVCKDIEGSWECDCTAGYVRDFGTQCKDDNECSPDVVADNCPGVMATPANSTCTNTDGSFLCECKGGYSASVNQEGVTICSNINECNDESLNNCDDNTECTDTIGAYLCTCVTGYKKTESWKIALDSWSCEDIDECSETDSDGDELHECDQNGVCENTDGGYNCSCKTGFRGDGFNCSNIDECEEGTYFCEPRSHCVDLIGSYKCECDAGSTENNEATEDFKQASNDSGVLICTPKRCLNKVCDKDDFSCDFIPDMEGVNCTCALEAGCSEDDQSCQENANLTPIDADNFLCICKKGFEMSDNGLCEDINECERSTDDCSESATCINKAPFWDCDCDTGYEGDGVDCSDINECANDDFTCDEKEYCSNTIGSYTCKCDSGTRRNPTSGECENIDECEEELDDCDPVLEICRDTEQSYTCDCMNGFERTSEDEACEDIDECSSSSPPCDFENSICLNTYGGVECSCETGYSLGEYGVSCDDVNECKEGTFSCSSLEKCKNTKGSYECTCKEGYEMDEDGKCTDVDECAEDSEICADVENTKCLNLPGSYTCNCVTGYGKSAFEKGCSDVNECSKPDSCPYPGTTCVNKQGSYSCECKDEGYVQVGTECQDIPECNNASDYCDEHATCEELEGSYRCTCEEGYRGSGKPGDCQDVNECMEASDECLPSSECVNSVGGYSCQCQTGFIAHCHVCLDIDECAQMPGTCKNGICSNTPGGFVCDCPEGFELVAAGSVCEDIDECARGIHACPALSYCKNSQGSFSCECDFGYEKKSDGSCVDIDECASSSGDVCPDNTDCENYNGGFSCKCQDGFRLNDDDACEDIDECEENTHNCVKSGTSCLNNEGSFSCECDSGYEKDENENCVNIDDCEEAECPEYSNCVDKLNGFRCTCDPGTLKLTQPDGSFICEPLDPCVKPETCSPGVCATFKFGAEYKYSCSCPEGYEVGNQGTNDEFCQESDPCLENECVNADCISVPLDFRNSELKRNYTCMCYDYEYWRPTEGNEELECEDIDECTEEDEGANPLHDCDEKDNQECKNTQGGFNCPCIEDYTRKKGECLKKCDNSFCDKENNECVEDLNEDTGKYADTCMCVNGFDSEADDQNCKDIDECELGRFICAENAECVNTVGYYDCVCKEGLQSTYPRVEDCTNIDECALELSECDENTTYCIDSDPLETGLLYECPCKRGYAKENGTCVIVDWDNVCWFDDAGSLCGNGTCKTNPSDPSGGFCDCPDGYTMNITLKACMLSEECETNEWCHKDATCKPTPEGVQCQCLPGYSGDGKTCTAKDKCALDIDNCDDNAICIPSPTTDGAYTCKCKAGFEGSGFLCTDIDECFTEPEVCGGNSTCTNKLGNYECTCYKGYYDVGFAGRGCEDIDECRVPETTSCHEEAECFNVQGSYACVCGEGWTGNGFDCEDVDECVEDKHKCALQGGICNNTEGSYSCYCDKEEGYSGDGFNCSKLEPACPEDCPPNSECVLGSGGSVCKCDDGYYKNGKGRCVELNECEQNNPCITQKCENKDGSFECTCGGGNELVDGVCVDIDECEDEEVCELESQVCANMQSVQGTSSAQGFKCFCTDLDCFEEFCNSTEVAKPEVCEKPSVCDENADKVEQTFSEYKCVCKEGFEGDGITCEDIDECLLSYDNCNETARCSNTVGSYECICLPGYLCIGDGDGPCGGGGGDECAEGAGCSEVPGQVNPQCECEEGKVGNGFEECEDEDPCANKTDCPEQSTCEVDEEGEAECVCLEGFTGPDCDVAEDMCDPENGGDELCTHEGAQCVSDPEGGFSCECKDGYEGHGLNCVDLNECEDINRVGNACLGDCVNTNGSFSCPACEADPGLTSTCEDIDECADSGLFQCPSGEECMNTEGSYACVCPDGQERKTSEGECQACGDDGCCPKELPSCDVTDPCSSDDLNFCNSDKSSCTPDGDSYTCECKSGFQSSDSLSLLCEDVDECAEGSENKCDDNAECVNEVGSYYCKCKAGYEGNGVTCEDVDECEMQNLCDGRATCVNTEGSYQCNCPEGFTKATNFAKCKDLNECAMDNDCNSTTSVCVNEVGSYKCICKQGYSLQATNTCVDTDECADQDDNGCSPFEKCVNEEGGYSCECREGFEEGQDGSCKDIDECVLQPCGPPPVSCTNTPGSYKCDCGFNLKFDGTTCVPVNNCQAKWHSKYDHDCPFMSKCRDTDEGYECDCLDGFQRTTEDGPCDDIDECADNSTCDGEICANLYGGFVCYCPAGFFRNLAGECEDLDECELKGFCVGSGSTCENTDGSFECTCASGFSRELKDESVVCVDSDECEEGTVDPCADIEGSVCVNLQVDDNLIRYSDAEKMEVSFVSTSPQPVGVESNFVIEYWRTNLEETLFATFDLGETKFVKSVHVLQQRNNYGNYATHGFAEVCGPTGKCAPCMGEFTDSDSYTTVHCHHVGNTIRIGQENRNMLLYVGPGGVKVTASDVTTDGYDCRCESGFEKKRDPATGKVKCVDVDECKNPLACDSNAECTNTEGTYTCTCNTGYFGNGLLCEPLCGPLTCGPYKTCEISADNKPECKCRVPSNLQKGNKGVTLMCGTDGKEYTSATQMISANCPLDIKVEVDYVGPCKEDCESIECLGGSKCIEDPVHGRPTCKCDKKCNETIYEPVCGSDGMTYPSECVLDRTICALKHNTSSDDSLKKVSEGVCPEDCVMSPWSEWGRCRAFTMAQISESEIDCGVGKSVRTRSIKQQPNENGKQCPSLNENVEEKYCYLAPCNDDPCKNMTCSGADQEYQVCRSAMCRCPECKFVPVSPVCGDAGTTFSSECELRKKACEKTVNDTAVQYDGKCDDSTNVQADPVECSLVSKTVTERGPNGRGTRVYKGRECKGGCLNLNHCCKPLQSFNRTVDTLDTLFVPGQGAITRPSEVMVELPTACGCTKEENTAD